MTFWAAQVSGDAGVRCTRQGRAQAEAGGGCGQAPGGGGAHQAPCAPDSARRRSRRCRPGGWMLAALDTLICRLLISDAW